MWKETEQVDGTIERVEPSLCTHNREVSFLIFDAFLVCKVAHLEKTAWEDFACDIDRNGDDQAVLVLIVFK